MKHVHADIVHDIGPNGVALLTLNRPQALNALTLPMIRAMTELLLAWRDDPQVHAVALRGNSKQGPFGAFCAGGDIRFLHYACVAGDPALEDFFTEEYTLDHLLFTYPKPVLAFMDGVVMGGGMGISQGAACRIVTERTKMAMPETNIGLFPDVCGGYFLSRCPGHVGEYLALTGVTIGAQQALAYGLADAIAPVEALPLAWQAVQGFEANSPQAFALAWGQWVARAGWQQQAEPGATLLSPEVESAFGQGTVLEIVQVLRQADTEAARQALAVLHARSPLMLNVTLEQIRRARALDYSAELRMERGMMRHCFHAPHLQRYGQALEAVEGIRALAVDKDQRPRWQPQRVEDVTPDMVAPFFDSPWPEHAHPLRHLA
ncbi:MAG TPA: enoyl-CoA hydratase/isomerase family protein [Macromonas sp.]|nr:enoyl-CoA hydratase/isomerase family protein [Macromonas sp.]